MEPTNTLVDDLSLSDEEDVGLEEGQGVGGGGTRGGGEGDDEEGPRNPSDGGTTTRSAKSSSLDFFASDLQKSMKRRREETNGEVTRHHSERKRLRSIFGRRGDGDMKNKQQAVTLESVKREGDKEVRDCEKEGEENSLVSDLSLSDSEDENEEKCVGQDEKTDVNAKNDAANSKKGEAWEDDGRWRSTVDKLRSIVKVRLHICKIYSRDKYIFKGGKEKSK